MAGAILAPLVIESFRKAVMDRHDEDKEQPKTDDKNFRAPPPLTKEDYEDMIRRSRELIKRVDEYLSRGTDPEK
jgi:broad specificity phosphatase PhoE